MSTSDEEVITSITIDKEISSNPSGTRLTISARLEKVVKVKKEFVKYKKDLFAQVVGGVITLCFALSYALIFCLAIPIAMIAMGAKYLDQCPAEHFIPIYLIVAGVFSLISSFIKYVLDDDNSCFECFQFLWFIAGCVWVYSVKQPSYNPTDKFFCNHLLYNFAYWIITLPLLEIAVLILLFVAFLCFQDVASYPV